MEGRGKRTMFSLSARLTLEPTKATGRCEHGARVRRLINISARLTHTHTQQPTGDPIHTHPHTLLRVLLSIQLPHSHTHSIPLGVPIKTHAQAPIRVHPEQSTAPSHTHNIPMGVPIHTQAPSPDESPFFFEHLASPYHTCLDPNGISGEGR